MPERPGGLVYVGGGPTDGVPQAYRSALDQGFDHVREQAWQDWWARADAPGRCDIFVWWNAAKASVRVARYKLHVDASIYRPVETLQGLSDPGEVARDDIRALFARLRSRFDLGDFPPMPGVLTETSHSLENGRG